MVLQIKDKNNELKNLNFCKYDDSTNCFVLNNDSVEVSIPYVLKKDDSFDVNNSLVYLIHHNSLPENCIIQLYERTTNKRIGWIFPIQALLSEDHGYKDHPLFLKVAYSAFRKLINQDLITLDEDNLTKKPKVTSDESLPLNDFYNQDGVIILLDKTEISIIPGFNLYDYAPSLFRYGYTFVFNPITEVHPLLKYEFFKEGQINVLKRKIFLEPLSDFIKKEDFIKNLFGDLLVKEKHPLVKFYLLYQVIELLIMKIFTNRFTKILSKPISRSEDLFNLRDKIFQISSETYRVNILLTEYTNVDSGELRELCLNFLNIREGERSKISLGDLIYKTRSFLVHNFRDISETQKDSIKDINHHLERLIISILTNYSEN